ncbi:MAG: prolyl oligopeptidase family serine peptidase [Bacteroidota bacterium]
MNKKPLLISLLVLNSIFNPLFSQQPNGTILSTESFEITTTHENLSPFLQWKFPKYIWKRAQEQSKYECLKITYQSDSLAVEGFIYKPKEILANYPVIIYNRGGLGDQEKISETDLIQFYDWAKAGFVVIAPNYRYINEMAAQDQWGGEELTDVLSLFPLIRRLGYADPRNIFMVGKDRGAILTAMCLRMEQDIKAAVFLSGISDARLYLDNHPDLVKGSDDTQQHVGLENILPNFDNFQEVYCYERSPYLWADKLSRPKPTPILILHSRMDKQVSVKHALKLAQALEQDGKIYSLVIYEDSDHNLHRYRFEVNQKIIDWLNKYRYGSN